VRWPITTAADHVTAEGDSGVLLFSSEGSEV
jgi:hypothetical protein